jgi:hypothetical protein
MIADALGAAPPGAQQRMHPDEERLLEMFRRLAEAEKVEVLKEVRGRFPL